MSVHTNESASFSMNRRNIHFYLQGSPLISQNQKLFNSMLPDTILSIINILKLEKYQCDKFKSATAEKKSTNEGDPSCPRVGIFGTSVSLCITAVSWWTKGASVISDLNFRDRWHNITLSISQPLSLCKSLWTHDTSSIHFITVNDEIVLSTEEET